MSRPGRTTDPAGPGEQGGHSPEGTKEREERIVDSVLRPGRAGGGIILDGGPPRQDVLPLTPRTSSLVLGDDDGVLQRELRSVSVLRSLSTLSVPRGDGEDSVSLLKPLRLRVSVTTL